ncbi:DNA recombination protein RmuC [Paracoccus sp. 1_MG-2023]|uniref:DNA recombination protein RmuC n=1 Tax=unclassified Paracoccus (in: a-proteobacteria) TaxID=2688777 RepID=UPI001C07F432|nr:MULTISPECIES: DNA recombination protein RmuC [unclassified Paracoccus (in: a-proteobacteria)]MBU2957469.1 DNA recombination protein RmuC [Paracoccus sp. C2R09]MDO6669667.1 DNA recombination protein RmuC [Paracoccus sp. 1_MG-2023]
MTQTGLLADPVNLQILLGCVAAIFALLWLRARQSAAVQLAEARLQAQEARHQAGLEMSNLTSRLDAQSERLGDLTEERDNLTDALHRANRDLADHRTKLAEVELTARKDREAAAREIATLRELREEMTGQFKLLSTETLRVQRADLQRSQNEQLNALLTPFREQVGRFQTELQARNKVLDQESARLHEQILSLHRRSEEISREAVNLTRALKGDKQRQGAWGEMVLERILEESGLQAGTHYDMQSSWRDEDNKLWRPDVVVKMPRGKVMVIDSKVSLNDYETAVTTDDPAQSQAALRRHVQALRNHVDTLAGKRYHRMDDASVDYVLMFIPIEGAFSEALRADPQLATYAMERRVGLTTPTTLMLTLRTIEHIWAVERRESNAMEIARRAGALYDKVAGFVDAMEGVGRALDQANKAHGQAMDRLSRGSGNVIRQVEMLRGLGARATKQISLDHDRDDLALDPPEEDA